MYFENNKNIPTGSCEEGGGSEISTGLVKWLQHSLSSEILLLSITAASSYYISTQPWLLCGMLVSHLRDVVIYLADTRHIHNNTDDQQIKLPENCQGWFLRVSNVFVMNLPKSRA